jgi:hypothetical protein
MAKPLRIIADMPTVQPGLGFPEYVEALADAVRGGEPPQFTIGLYGSWGSGKSSLLVALADLLSRPDSGVLPVLFDAWRYEKSDFIVVPLLHAIYTRASELGHRDLARTLRRALESIVFSVNFSLNGLGIDPKAAKQAWEDSGLAPLDSAFSRPFAELRKVPEVLHKERIAILVDDLDRCSSDHVVELLETINLIMDIPGFVFILALDYDVLVNAVQKRYPHASGHDFIQKIVQLPFRVPPLEVTANDFMALVPEWDDWKSHLPAAFVNCSVDISVMGLRGNPRQIKRFLNSFIFVQRIVESRRLRVDYERLAAIIGLQLAWPNHYRLLQEALVIGDSEPFAGLLSAAEEAGDAWLSRYVSRFFTATKEGAKAELRTLLQLTAVVVGTGGKTAEALPPLPGPADKVRELNRKKMIENLKAAGYSQPFQNSRFWYSTKHPNWRFVFRRHIVNLEKRVGNKWEYWRSYLLTREAEQAIKDVGAPNRVKHGRQDAAQSLREP